MKDGKINTLPRWYSGPSVRWGFIPTANAIVGFNCGTRPTTINKPPTALRVEEEVFLEEELIVGWVGVSESQSQHIWL